MGEVIPDSAATKKWLLPFCQTTIWRSVRIRGPELKARKLNPGDGFRHSLHEWSSPRNKSKNKWKSSTEVLPRKFYWKKSQLKENSTENSAEKNLKEDSKFNELRNFSIKQKNSNSKNFVSRTLSQISFQQIVLKICNTLSFLSLSSSFLLYKIPF